ncbi:MAG: DNA-binding protein [Planctomycetes bacterium]|nr:DNA-binding protein [Planctomycetota bacterium]
MLALAQQIIEPIPGFYEPFSSLSHLIGAGIALVLTVPLMRRARGHAGRVFIAALFAFTVIFQLSMSGVYHLLGEGAGREVLQRLDHAAIFSLIAGTLTIVHGLLFRGWMRWGMIGGVWAMAATAITLKSIFFDDVPEWMSLSMYLVLGWLGLVSGAALWRRFGWAYVRPIVWGGLAYTIGAVCEFVRWPWIWPNVIGPHEVFHLAVLIGIGCHAYFVYGIAGGHVDPITVVRRMDE